VVAVADPAAPRELAQLAGVPHTLTGLALVRGVDAAPYVIAAGTPQSAVIDTSDPAHPRSVADVPGAVAVAVDGELAYFAEAAPRATAFDLSLPAAPHRAASYEAKGTGFADIAVVGGVAYLADPVAGVRVVDFRDPGNPSVLAAEPTATAATGVAIASIGARTIAVATTPAGLRTVDGAGLATLATWQLRALVPLASVHVAGTRAYVAALRDGVRVVDLADPAAPADAGYFNTWREGTGSAATREGAVAIDVDTARGLVYVADTIRGLVILRRLD
jgi:hypothetical protein